MPSKQNETMIRDIDAPEIASGFDDDDLDPRLLFEDKMLKRVHDDFGAADQFLTEWHASCAQAYKWYHNASEYESLDKAHKFPMPFTQKQVDTFVSFIMDRLYYKDRPCTVVGREDTDKKDATAKQGMLDYQDWKDNTKTKMNTFVHDAALYRAGILQVGYVERYKRELIGGEEPSMYQREDGQMVPESDPVGRPVMISTAKTMTVPVYLGPETTRVDPTNFFFGQDKKRRDDDHPLMIRSYHLKNYFTDPTKEHFINTERLEEITPGTSGQGGAEDVEQNVYLKRMARGYKPDASSQRNYI